MQNISSIHGSPAISKMEIKSGTKRYRDNTASAQVKINFETMMALVLFVINYLSTLSYVVIYM